MTDMQKKLEDSYKNDLEKNFLSLYKDSPETHIKNALKSPLSIVKKLTLIGAYLLLLLLFFISLYIKNKTTLSLIIILFILINLGGNIFVILF